MAVIDSYRQGALARSPTFCSIYTEVEIAVHKEFDLHSPKDVQLMLNGLYFMVGLKSFKEKYGYGAHNQLIVIHYMGVNIALLGRLRSP